MNKELSPIAIFTYIRNLKLQKLLNSLAKNVECKKTEAFFFCDYPIKKKDFENYKKVINIVRKTNIFRKKKINFRKENFGLKKNITDGVSDVLKKNSKVIVLEDDLEIGKYFLKYMNTALNEFANNKKIYSISGYNIPNFSIKNFNFEGFLLKRPCSYGWATWKRSWKSARFLNEKLADNKDLSIYGNDLLLMKKSNNIKKKSWAFFWTSYHIKKKKFCVYPYRSLVNNLGNDSESSNNFFKTDKFYHNSISDLMPNIKKLCSENTSIIKQFKSIYDKNLLIYILARIKHILK